MAGEEREGSVASSQNTFKGYVRIKKNWARFKRVQSRSALKKSVKTRKSHRSGKSGLCHVFLNILNSRPRSQGSLLPELPREKTSNFRFRDNIKSLCFA